MQARQQDIMIVSASRSASISMGTLQMPYKLIPTCLYCSIRPQQLIYWQMRTPAEQPDPTPHRHSLNYHLKKTEPLPHRTKKTVAQQMRTHATHGTQGFSYGGRHEKVSTIPSHLHRHRGRQSAPGTQHPKGTPMGRQNMGREGQLRDNTNGQQPPEHDHINQQHINQNTMHLASTSSRVAIYDIGAVRGTGSGPKQLFQRGSSAHRRKLEVVERGKSLKYFRVEAEEPKLLSHIRGFFNTIMSDEDGCNCGVECGVAARLLHWVGVTEDKIIANFDRMINLAYRDMPGHQSQGQSQHKSKHEQALRPQSRNAQPKHGPKLEPRHSSKPWPTSRPISTQQSQPDDYSQYERSLNQQDQARNLGQIRKDITRTQTQCPLFRRQQVQTRLERILYCYTVQDPEVGYVQSMNIVLSGLLYHIRHEARTYAVYRKLMLEVRPIYLQDFQDCHTHIDAIVALLKLNLSQLYGHLVGLGVDLHVVLFPWVLSLLCVLVPLEYLGHVYLGFVREGWLYIYRGAVAIFLYHRDTLMQMDEHGDVLVFLSVSNEGSRGDVEWGDVMRFIDRLRL